jgi:hypothetical protein
VSFLLHAGGAEEDTGRDQRWKSVAIYEVLNQAGITEVGTLLKERISSCEESLLKHKVIADLEVTSGWCLKQLLQECKALKPS